jgi:hypothetical protein
MLDVHQILFGCALPAALAAVLALLVRLLVPLGGRSAALAAIVPAAFVLAHFGMEKTPFWSLFGTPLTVLPTPLWALAAAALVIFPTIMLTVPVARWWSRLIGAVLLVAAVATVAAAQLHGMPEYRAMPSGAFVSAVLITTLIVLVGIKLVAIGAALLPPLVGSLALAAVAGGVALTSMLATSHQAGQLAIGLLAVLLGVAAVAWVRRTEAPASTAAAIAIPAAAILGALLTAQHVQSSYPIAWPALAAFALALPAAALGRLIAHPVGSFVVSGLIALALVGAGIGWVAAYGQPPPNPYAY